jgi:glycosyltransferase involved in cell wall biosynthesis
MATISLCMIVKDEEKFIADAISSVLSVVDEVIVMDTGSTDSTKRIAEELGAKVFETAWEDDFSLARNESLKHATGDWILILDADEVISEPDAIKKMAERSDIAGFMFTQRNYNNDSKLRGWTPIQKSSKYTKGFSGWVPAKIIRMFQNNKKIRFEGEVHETVKPSIEKIKGLIAEVDVFIHHYGMMRKARIQVKAEKYEKLGREKAKTGNAKAYYELAKQLAQNGKYDEAILNFKKAIETKPDYARAFADFGGLLLSYLPF